MTKPPYIPGRTRGKNLGAAARSEPGPDEDRPFAEIRRIVHDVLRIVSLHRWAFFVPFSVVTCAAFILSLYYPRTYSATTSFERRNDPVMMNLPMSAGAASFKYFRSTIVRDLTSIECMREVSEKLGLLRDLERSEDGALTKAAQRRRDALAHTLAGTLSVSTVSPSEHIDIVKITYTGLDSTIGKRLVDEVKRTYIQRTMAWIHEFLASQRDYFLRDAQEALEEVKQAQHGETRMRLESPDVDPGNPGAIALELSQLETERRELLLRQREYEAERSALQQAIATDRQTISADAILGTATSAEAFSPQANQIITEIHEIERQLEDRRTKRGMTDRHPEMAELLSRGQWLAGELDLQRDRDRTAAAANVALGAAAAGAPAALSLLGHAVSGEGARTMVQIAAVEAKLKDLTISIQFNDENLNRLRRAKDEVFQKQDEFADVMGAVARAKQRHQQIEVTLASIEPAIKAIEQHRLLRFDEGQPAGGSSKPISPKAATVVLLALLAGIACGVFFVILAEVFDHVYRSSGQVARNLGLPMLESIDEIVTARDRRSLFLRNAVLTPLVILGFIGLTGLTGSMAYLSIEQPWTYLKIKRIPEAALHLFAARSLNPASSVTPES